MAKQQLNYMLSAPYAEACFQTLRGTPSPRQQASTTSILRLDTKLADPTPGNGVVLEAIKNPWGMPTFRE